MSGKRDPRRPTSAELRILRPLIFDRDGHRCQLRMPGCTHTASPTVPLELHHIRPVDDWPIDTPPEVVNDPTNLLTTCRSCNRRWGTGWQDQNTAHRDWTKPQR